MNISHDDFMTELLKMTEADRRAEITNVERNIKSLRDQADKLEAHKTKLIEALATLTK